MAHCLAACRDAANHPSREQLSLDEYEREVELIDYIEVLLRRWAMVVALTLLSGIIVGISSLLGARQYESQALVVVSQPLASTRVSGEDGVLGTEIQVSGMAAQTYEALAKSDELIQGLRDSLLAMSSLSEAAHLLVGEAEVSEVGEEFLSADLVEATEKAESPLLAFKAVSTIEDLPVAMVNRWVELFVQRHRGLSSNVADDYYQWVQGQYATAKTNLESTEDELRELTTAYSQLNVLQTEMDFKTDRLDSGLTTYQRLSTELEAKQRELDFVRRRIEQLEFRGTWVGYLESTSLPSTIRSAPDPPLSNLIALRRDLEISLTDSFTLAASQERDRREFEAKERDQLLAFERQTGIERVRTRVAEVDSTLGVYRGEAARLDQQIKDLGLSLDVYGRNLVQEPPFRRTAKAIVDEDLWRRVGSGAKVDEDVQAELGRYRLVTESVNPTHEALSTEIRQLQIRYDRATTRIGFLEGEIPLLEAELSELQAGLDTLAEAESLILNNLSKQRASLVDSLARRARPVVKQVGRKRGALDAHEEDYTGLKQRAEQLAVEVGALRQDVEFEKANYEEWSRQVEGRLAVVDSLARRRRTLSREQSVFQSTFDRFANLLEEARIAREQAAGDIQIVSRAVAPRPVPRGTVKKAAIAAIVGLMGSVMLAFLLEYVARARETRDAPQSPAS